MSELKVAEGIVQGIKDRWTVLLNQMIFILVNGFKLEFDKFKAKILEIGNGIVGGVWQGIKDKAEEFGKNITAFFQGMVQTAKDAIGWHSPPAAFVELGAGAGKAYVNSLGAALKAGTADLQKAFGSSALALNVNANGAGTGSGGNSTVNQTIFQLQALYQNQPRESLVNDIRFLQSLYGEA